MYDQSCRAVRGPMKPVKAPGFKLYFTECTYVLHLPGKPDYGLFNH